MQPRLGRATRHQATARGAAGSAGAALLCNPRRRSRRTGPRRGDLLAAPAWTDLAAIRRARRGDYPDRHYAVGRHQPGRGGRNPIHPSGAASGAGQTSGRAWRNGASYCPGKRLHRPGRAASAPQRVLPVRPVRPLWSRRRGRSSSRRWWRGSSPSRRLSRRLWPSRRSADAARAPAPTATRTATPTPSRHGNGNYTADRDSRDPYSSTDPGASGPDRGSTTGAGRSDVHPGGAVAHRRCRGGRRGRGGLAGRTLGAQAPGVTGFTQWPPYVPPAPQGDGPVAARPPSTRPGVRATGLRLLPAARPAWAWTAR